MCAFHDPKFDWKLIWLVHNLYIVLRRLEVATLTNIIWSINTIRTNINSRAVFNLVVKTENSIISEGDLKTLVYYKQLILIYFWKFKIEKIWFYFCKKKNKTKKYIVCKNLYFSK